jgi:hypothetical protein
MDLEKIEPNKHAKILYQSLRDLNRKKIKEISTHTNSSDITNNGGITGLINNAEQIIGNDQKYFNFIWLFLYLSFLFNLIIKI